jgi:hypothetical protein
MNPIGRIQGVRSNAKTECFEECVENPVLQETKRRRRCTKGSALANLACSVEKGSNDPFNRLKVAITRKGDKKYITLLHRGLRILVAKNSLQHFPGEMCACGAPLLTSPLPGGGIPSSKRLGFSFAYIYICMEDRIAKKTSRPRSLFLPTGWFLRS